MYVFYAARHYLIIFSKREREKKKLKIMHTAHCRRSGGRSVIEAIFKFCGAVTSKEFFLLPNI
jgi:hypothetical protein